VPVEISPGVGAWLVIGYRAALDLLNDPETWSKDPRAWQAQLPEDCPIRPMMEWRPNPLFTDGAEHARYRAVVVDSFSLIEPHQLRAQVAQVADQLIQRFAERGRADLVAHYARELPLRLFNRLFGMPDVDGDRLLAALGGMLEANSPQEATASGAAFAQYVTDLVTSKQQRRAADLTSWYIDHPAGLSVEEVLHNVILTLGAGNEPTANLISNSLSRMLSDDRYYSSLAGGALTVWDAIQDVLRNEPPMANYGAHFPRRTVQFHGTWIQAGELVMISFAAANTTPDHLPPGPRSDPGAHLAWSAGPHSCPVKQPALLIAATAIERLTSYLCDMELAVPRAELPWRPGPFHTALASLPVRFSPIRPEQPGVTPWSSSPSSSTPQDATSPPRQPASASTAPPSR
jgi:cytochrome P450